jgi:hypothetical protein
MSGIYDFNVPAGGSQRLSVVGDPAKLVSCSAALPLRIRLDGGDAFACLEGQGPRSIPGRPFGDVTIFNPNAVAISGFIFIGDARFEDTRITGNVRVIDQGADKTLAGSQFFSTTYAGAAAAKFGIAGVLAGTKPLYIKRMTIASSAAGSLRLFTSTGAPTDTAASAALLNKMLGSAAASAVRWVGLAAAITPTGVELPGNVGYLNALVAASTPYELPLTTPIRIAPGQGFFAVGGVANSDVVATVDAEE